MLGRLFRKLLCGLGAHNGVCINGHYQCAYCKFRRKYTDPIKQRWSWKELLIFVAFVIIAIAASIFI